VSEVEETSIAFKHGHLVHHKTRLFFIWVKLHFFIPKQNKSVEFSNSYRLRNVN